MKVSVKEINLDLLLNIAIAFYIANQMGNNWGELHIVFHLFMTLCGLLILTFLVGNNTQGVLASFQDVLHIGINIAVVIPLTNYCIESASEFFATKGGNMVEDATGIDLANKMMNEPPSSASAATLEKADHVINTSQGLIEYMTVLPISSVCIFMMIYIVVKGIARLIK